METEFYWDSHFQGQEKPTTFCLPNNFVFAPSLGCDLTDTLPLEQKAFLCLSVPNKVFYHLHTCFRICNQTNLTQFGRFLFEGSVILCITTGSQGNQMQLGTNFLWELTSFITQIKTSYAVLFSVVKSKSMIWESTAPVLGLSRAAGRRQLPCVSLQPKQVWGPAPLYF